MSDSLEQQGIKRKNNCLRPDAIPCSPDRCTRNRPGFGRRLPALFLTIISRYDMLAQPLLKLPFSTVLFKVIGSNDTGYDLALAFNMSVMKTRRGDSL
jgi:hypothetical protein